MAGVLSFTIVAGKDLAAKDMNGKSDPYVKASLLEGFSTPTLTTPVQEKTLSPVWNFSGEFVIGAPDSRVKFEVWDKDTIGSDDFMGECYLHAETLEHRVTKREHLPLQRRMSKKGKEKKEKITGTLELEWTFIDNKKKIEEKKKQDAEQAAIRQEQYQKEQAVKAERLQKAKDELKARLGSFNPLREEHLALFDEIEKNKESVYGARVREMFEQGYFEVIVNAMEDLDPRDPFLTFWVATKLLHQMLSTVKFSEIEKQGRTFRLVPKLTKLFLSAPPPSSPSASSASSSNDEEDPLFVKARSHLCFRNLYQLVECIMRDVLLGEQDYSAPHTFGQYLQPILKALKESKSNGAKKSMAAALIVALPTHQPKTKEVVQQAEALAVLFEAAKTAVSGEDEEEKQHVFQYVLHRIFHLICRADAETVMKQVGEEGLRWLSHSAIPAAIRVVSLENYTFFRGLSHMWGGSTLKSIAAEQRKREDAAASSSPAEEEGTGDAISFVPFLRYFTTELLCEGNGAVLKQKAADGEMTTKRMSHIMVRLSEFFQSVAKVTELSRPLHKALAETQAVRIVQEALAWHTEVYECGLRALGLTPCIPVLEEEKEKQQEEGLSPQVRNQKAKLWEEEELALVQYGEIIRALRNRWHDVDEDLRRVEGRNVMVDMVGHRGRAWASRRKELNDELCQFVYSL
ncbi:calcium-dependent phospholipid binding [Balamuthia mandrillaris]